MLKIAQEEKENNTALIITLVLTFTLIVLGCLFYLHSNNKLAEKNYILAKDEFRNSKLENAQRLLEEAKPPKSLEADYYKLLLDVYFNQNKLEQVKTICEKLIKINPEEKALYYYLISLVCYNYGNNEECISYLTKAIEADNKNLQYKYYLANVFYNSGQLEKALKGYNEIINLDKNYENAWVSIAQIYENKQDYQNALKYRQQAVNIFKNNAYHSYFLARLYEKLKDKEKAIKYYAITIQNDIAQESDAKSKYFELSGKPYHSDKQFKTITMPLTEKDGLYYIKATYANQETEFLIDTGASISVIYTSFLNKNSIKYQTNTKTVVTLANGSNSVAYLMSGDFTIGNSVLDNVIYAIIDDSKHKMDIAGIIGNDILKRTDYYIDKNAKKITLKVP